MPTNQAHPHRTLRTLTIILGLALLYAALAWMGLRGDREPAVMPALGLASGVGLAAVVLGGPPMTLGVLLGAFAANLGQLGGPAGAPLAAALAAAAAFQAWLGALLLRRLVGPLPPPTASLALRAITVTALPAAVTPLVGVVSLGLAGSLSWGGGEAIDMLWRWWVGIYAGMLVGTPTLVVLGRLRQRQAVADSITWPLVGLTVGLAFVSFLLAWDEQERQLDARLQADAARVALLLEQSVRGHQSSLAAVHAFFDASREVDGAEFKRFVAPLLAQAQAIKAISWAQHVPAAERAAFEGRMRVAGLPEFTIFQLDADSGRVPATGRAAFFPATFIQPLDPHRAVLGFDLGSEKARRAAIESALETGRPALTLPIRLLQDPGAQPDLLLFRPVYGPGEEPGTPEERRTRLKGLVYAVLETETLLDEALARSTTDDLELYLFDVSEGSPRLLSLRPSRSGPQDLPPTVDVAALRASDHDASTIRLFGRSWLLITRPGPAYIAEARGTTAWVRLLIGLVSAALLLYMDTRRRAEARLRVSEHRSQLLLRALPDLMFRMTREGVILDYAAAPGERLYARPETFLGRHVDEVLPPELAGEVVAAIGRAHDSGRLQTFEYQLAFDGETRTFEARLDINASEGEAVAIVRDITESRTAAEALRRSEAQYRLISEHAADVIWVLDLEEQRFTYVSPSVAKLRGYAPHEVLGQTMAETLTPASYAKVRALLTARTPAPGLPPVTVELDQTCKDGAIVTTEVTTTYAVGEGGRLQVVGVSRDITERKRAEEALRAREEIFSTIVGQALDAIVLIDEATGAFVEFNEAAHRDLGYTRAEFARIGIAGIQAEHTPDGVRAIIQRILDHGSASFETRHRHKGGDIREVHVRAHRLLLRERPLVAAVWTDITERKQAEQRLRWLSRTYRVLSEVHTTILRERDSRTLFDAACRIAVEEGGFRMAWIGLYDSITRRVWPIASAGVTTTYLERLNITVDDSPRGHGPVGTAVVTGTYAVIGAIEHDARMAPWRDEALALGYRSCASFPLIVEGAIHGVLTLYSSEPDFFDEAELKILAEMTLDIAFALEGIEREWQRRRAEERLRASERRSQALLRAMPDLMLRVTQAGMILDYAASAGQHLPAPAEELIGHELSAVLPAKVALQGLAAIGRAIESGALQTFIYQLDEEGATRFYEARVSANAAEDEAVMIIRDVTESRRALAEITQLSRVVEQMDDLLIITDVAGRIQYVNPAFEREFGYTRDEALGQTPRLISSGLEGQEFYARLWSTILGGESFQAEIRNRRKDGLLLYEDLTITPLRDEAGVITHFVATGKDVTARKQIEHELHERLKELTCLRQVQRLLERDPALDELGPQVVADVAAAMQFPEAAAAQLELDGRLYGAAAVGAMPPERRLSAAILVGGAIYGRLSAAYLDAHISGVPEEQNLIDGVAHSLGLWLERRRAEEALTTERNSLAHRVNERTADLSRANADLARAVRTKDDFLANMSHELRTPLNAILALSEGLLEQLRGPLNERQAAALHTIETSGRHLLTLINDILDLSKVEAGRMELYCEHVLVREVCQVSLIFVKELAARKQIQLSFRLSDPRAIIVADPKRLKQVLVNLLSNAVKFTPAGGSVSLEVDLEAADGRISFAVSDTGIGIPPEGMERLFQPFVQLDSGLSRQHEGTGLGLALVRRLTEMHGGSVSVESEPGVGSRFVVALPYLPVPAAAVAPSALNGAEDEHVEVILADAWAAPVRVLLVEDNEFTIVAMGDYLRDRGYAVAVARNGREALDLAGEVQPDVILMDVQMPVMDGLEATRQLRASPAFAQTPIIALTALAMPGDRERCLAAGATAYVIKPVSLRGLVETIRGLTHASDAQS